MAGQAESGMSEALESEVSPGSLTSTQIKVIWSLINQDLGKYHNLFIEEFPNCLFVRVVECGSECTLKAIGPGGLALIKESVMLNNGTRKLDLQGKVSIDRDMPFLILEDDIIAFGKFENLKL